MILYTSGGIWYVLKLFQMQGSVFPHSLMVAIPCATIAAAMRWAMNEEYLRFLEAEDSILKETQAWSGFSFLVGFLIVFRTSQAYNRFWDGCTATHQMRAEWFDACSALIAFCAHSKAEIGSVMRFKNTLIRLFSMLHAAALAELEEINTEGRHTADIKAYGFELVDAIGIDAQSLQTIKDSTSKVELIFTWIQLLIVEEIETGVMSIPPPILSRAFQEIANGMVAFHDALKITYIPFPFPYAQTCDCLLVLHWIVVPFVTSQWVSWPSWAFIFVFIQVFILWSLNFIAVEIENPFGTDSNDLAGSDMQIEMNRNLILLLHQDTIRTPRLAQRGSQSFIDEDENKSFLDVWRELDLTADGNNNHHQDSPPAMSARKDHNFIKAFAEKNSNRDKSGEGRAGSTHSNLSRLASASAFTPQASWTSKRSLDSLQGGDNNKQFERQRSPQVEVGAQRTRSRTGVEAEVQPQEPPQSAESLETRGLWVSVPADSVVRQVPVVVGSPPQLNSTSACSTGPGVQVQTGNHTSVPAGDGHAVPRLMASLAAGTDGRALPAASDGAGTDRRDGPTSWS